MRHWLNLTEKIATKKRHAQPTDYFVAFSLHQNAGFMPAGGTITIGLVVNFQPVNNAIEVNAPGFFCQQIEQIQQINFKIC